MMRWIGAGVLAVLVVIGLLSLLGQGPAVPSLGLGAPPTPEEQATAYAADDARLVQTDATGTPVYRLQAKSLEQKPDSETVFADELTLDYAPPAGSSTATVGGMPWTLTARKGEMPGGTLTMKLSGNVKLVGQPAGWRSPLRFETQGLDFDIERQFAQTKLPVNFYSGPRRVSSRGLSADLKRGTLRLESSVHGRFPP